MRTLTKTLVLVCMITGAAGGVALVQGRMMASGDKEAVRPAESISFSAVTAGVSRAVLWGDPERGPHGALTKFDGGTMQGPHLHSATIRIVVVSGTFVYKTEDGERRLGPGSYLLIPGGRTHDSGAGAEGVTFFQEATGKFDLRPAEGGVEPAEGEGGKAMMPPKRK